MVSGEKERVEKAIEGLKVLSRSSILGQAKVTMKEMGMEYSMSSFKSLMTNIYLVKRIFKAIE